MDTTNYEQLTNTQLTTIVGGHGAKPSYKCTLGTIGGALIGAAGGPVGFWGGAMAGAAASCKFKR